MIHKLGLRESRNFALHLGDYVDPAFIKTVPSVLNWTTGLSFKGDAFGNLKWSDCYWTAAAKLLMLQSANAGNELQFTEADVLTAYAAGTGFAYTDATDQGTEPVAGFKFLEAKGIAGQKFGPTLSVSPTRPALVMAGLHLAGGGMVGTKFYANWENRTNWDLTNPGAFKGYHETVIVAADLTKGTLIHTWDDAGYRLIPWGTLAQVCDQLTVCINPQFFKNGKAPNALDYATIQADAALIATGGTYDSRARG